MNIFTNTTDASTSNTSARLRTALLACCLTFVASQGAHAEDIEIYTGLTGDVTAESASSEQKPNILFVLDTSGSMGEPEVVLNARPPYDSTTDYGSSVDDDIYVYDSDRVFTGMFVAGANNNCAAATELYAENPEFPEYLDKALVWEYIAPTTETVETCVPASTVTVSRTRSRRGWTIVDRIPVTPGDNYELNYTASRNVRIEPEFHDEDDNNIPPFPCSKDISANVETNCASGVVPDGAVELLVYYYRNGASSTTVSADYIISGACTTEVVTTSAAGDWKDLTDDSSRIQALECELDNGVHGASDGDTDVYAQYQEDSNSDLSSPNYVSAAGNVDAVDWNSSSVPQRYLFPGNYHDYLQSSVIDLLGGITVVDLPGTDRDDVTTFCKERGDNVRFGDNDGFDGVVTAVYPNGGKYVQHNGAIYECQTRIGALKEATNNILSTMKGANVGIMRFNAFEGGSLLSAVQDIDSSTEVDDGSGGTITVSNRQAMIDKLLALPGVGATPLQETLYEAYRYFAGLTPLTATQEKQISATANSTVDYPTDILSTNASLIDPLGLDGSPERYVSPIQNHCQDNNIILFSDGEATSDLSSAAAIAAFSGRACSAEENGACLDELAFGMATKDVNSTVRLDNHVYLHTIGFGDDVAGSTQLLNASNQGLRPGAEAGSQHYEASDSAQLTSAFQSILLSLVNVESDSFVAPAVAVNAFNRLQFRDELYFAIFEPQNTPRWSGNIKKYRVNSDGEIIDANGLDAVDDSGFFQENAESLWGNVVDGADVNKGGVARQLDIDPARKLYANLDSSSDNIYLLNKTNFLTQINDPLISSVTSIGATNSPDVLTNSAKIVAWSLGEDVDQDLQGAPTDPNFFLGESLHGTPYVVDYGTATTPRDMLFATTNQGLLHAVNGQTGEEEWAYIPDPTLFANLGAYFNQAVGADHKYGLDGEIEFDLERDPETRAITKANLFVGQRRGGEKYFGIDVKNAYLDGASTVPVSKLWTLENLPRMAQSWAKPVSATINFCTDEDTCGDRKVLVISGGYDPKYDDYVDADGDPISVASLSDTVRGNAIYIVDRETGNLLWMAGKDESQVDTGDGKGYFTNEAMTHSFPTEPTVVDADFDGVADLMFAIDIAGRIWRFDFRGSVETDDTTGEVTLDENDILVGDNNDLSEVAGGIIADLSEPNVNRRFYNPLDVSVTPRTSIDLARYNLVVGSGYRAHPIVDEGVQNRIYFIFDRNIQTPKLIDTDSDGGPDSVSYEYVVSATDSDNITSDDISSKNNTIRLVSVPGGAHEHGFYVNLAGDTKEKLINPTITDDGIVVAVSYSPSPPVTNGNNDLCEKNTGTSSLYFVDLVTGTAAVKELAKAGISTQAVVILVPATDENGDEIEGETKKILLIGSESFDASEEIAIEQEDDDEIGKLVTPGLNESNVGKVIKFNWWERRQ